MQSWYRQKQIAKLAKIERTHKMLIHLLSKIYDELARMDNEKVNTSHRGKSLVYLSTNLHPTLNNHLKQIGALKYFLYTSNPNDHDLITLHDKVEKEQSELMKAINKLLLSDDR